MSGRYSIVPADPQADRPELLAVATRNRPGPRERIELKFAKYYESNPLGPPSAFLARDNESEAFVGASALFPTILRVSGEPVPAAISADFAVDEGTAASVPPSPSSGPRWRRSPSAASGAPTAPPTSPPSRSSIAPATPTSGG